MTNKILKTCTAVVLLGMASVSVQAATIELKPTGNSSINIGESVLFELWADFSDVGGTFAGGLDIFYDATVLSYNGDFAFDAGFGVDTESSRIGHDCSASYEFDCNFAGEINGIAPIEEFFGNMAVDGSSLMGTLSFTGLANGSTDLTMADNDDPVGSWYAADYSVVSPDYLGASVTVSAIPVPAAAWLFGSGLLGLIGVARRKA